MLLLLFDDDDDDVAVLAATFADIAAFALVFSVVFFCYFKEKSWSTGKNSKEGKLRIGKEVGGGRKGEEKKGEGKGKRKSTNCH